MKKNTDKNKYWKRQKKKQYIMKWQTKSESVFLPEIMQARRQWIVILNVLNKNSRPRNLKPMKIFLQCESTVKILGKY